MYKIIALDMDGTLLNDDKIITEVTKKALKSARDKGVKVVLASGRPIDGLRRYLEKLGLVDDNEYVLSYNGCLVQETKSEKIISEKGLKGRDLHYIYNFAREFGVNIHAFSPTRGLITPKNSKYTEVEAEINKIDINICDFDEISEDESIIKIMLIDEPDVLDKAIAKLPKEVGEKYNLAKSTPYFFEIINKESNKGLGLKALADYLNVDKDEIIAVGDAENDLDMIEFAGLGVAMENGHSNVKEAANYITKSNNEDGVAEVVKKFILK
ncbi:sugar-phosphatase [Clostridium paraputrificum]|uniref:sugar-phosphatase n=1 Tax=Clostridium paraputrificum TaxID=29363 RepID=UPI00189E0868|nr:sugar-phosphatase [Clostridium paraputrificum]